MCSVDFEPSKIFEVAARVARKPHRCHECWVYILPGESYAAARWLGDSAWDGSNRCAMCFFLCEAIEELECGDEGQIYWGAGGLQDELFNLGLTAEWASDAFAAIKDRSLEAP